MKLFTQINGEKITVMLFICVRLVMAEDTLRSLMKKKFVIGVMVQEKFGNKNKVANRYGIV